MTEESFRYLRPVGRCYILHMEKKTKLYRGHRLHLWGTCHVLFNKSLLCIWGFSTCSFLLRHLIMKHTEDYQECSKMYTPKYFLHTIWCTTYTAQLIYKLISFLDIRLFQFFHWWSILNCLQVINPKKFYITTHVIIIIIIITYNCTQLHK